MVNWNGKDPSVIVVVKVTSWLIMEIGILVDTVAIPCLNQKKNKILS
jgi:hypothetical protein